MNTEYIQDVLTIINSGSINKAAQKLNTTPHRLANILTNIENEFDARFFIRSHHGLTLTDDGKFFIEQLKQINLIIKNMKEQFALEKKALHITGELKIYSAPSFKNNYVLKCIHYFGKAYPEIRVKYYEYPASAVLEKVAKETDSIGIVDTLASNDSLTEFSFPNIQLFPLIRMTPVAVFSSNNSLIDSKLTSISLRRLAKLPAVSLVAASDSFDESLIARIFNQHNFIPEIKYETDRLQVFYDLLRHGDCYSIAFVNSVDEKTLPEYPDLTLIPIREPIYSTLNIAINASNEKATIVKSFFDYLFVNRTADWAINEDLDYARLATY